MYFVNIVRISFNTCSLNDYRTLIWTTVAGDRKVIIGI